MDKRRHCFSVQTESGEDMFFSVELECELLVWEKAFQMATFLEVERIQVWFLFKSLRQFQHSCFSTKTDNALETSVTVVTLSLAVLQCKTYACIMESHLMGLTIDFSMGFVCFDAASKVGALQSSLNPPPLYFFRQFI